MITSKKILNQYQDIYQFKGRVSNIYILIDKLKDSTYLVDCGLPSDSRHLISLLHSFPPLKAIICTHFHVDHSSGWILLKNQFKNCLIYFHTNAKPFLFGEKRIPFPSFASIKHILLPCMKDYHFFPNIKDLLFGGLYGTPFKKGFPLDRLYFFSDVSSILPGFTTIHTPGHRPDSSSFLHIESGILISGDFIIAIKKKPLFNTYLSSVTNQIKSKEIIISHLSNINYIYPGHGDIINIYPDLFYHMH